MASTSINAAYWGTNHSARKPVRGGRGAPFKAAKRSTLKEGLVIPYGGDRILLPRMVKGGNDTRAESRGQRLFRLSGP